MRDNRKGVIQPGEIHKLDKSAESHLISVTDEVKSLTIHLAQKKLISCNDKTLISGLNINNNSKLAPEYKPESPYSYPLFKLHKLTEKRY